VVLAGDYNGDNKIDLAVANFDGGSVSILLGNGDGIFQTHQAYGTNLSARCMTVGDLRVTIR
jgi:hypothetical protein